MVHIGLPVLRHHGAIGYLPHLKCRHQGLKCEEEHQGAEQDYCVQKKQHSMRRAEVDVGCVEQD
jgi:hypothetical protein